MIFIYQDKIRLICAMPNKIVKFKTCQDDKATEGS